MKRLWGIRVEEETETAGLDVSEHGMWGYPEFYIPVPGGYGVTRARRMSTDLMFRPSPTPARNASRAA